MSRFISEAIWLALSEGSFSCRRMRSRCLCHEPDCIPIPGGRLERQQATNSGDERRTVMEVWLYVQLQTCSHECQLTSEIEAEWAMLVENKIIPQRYAQQLLEEHRGLLYLGLTSPTILVSHLCHQMAEQRSPLYLTDPLHRYAPCVAADKIESFSDLIHLVASST